MFITKNRKASLVKSLAALDGELASFEALRVEVQEKFGLDLFSEIQTRLRSFSLDSGYMGRIKAIAEDLRVFSKRKTGNYDEYLQHVRLANKYVSELNHFIHWAGERESTFDFNTTVENMRANLNGILSYVNVCNHGKSRVTASGAGFIEVYRTKVRNSCLADLRILDLMNSSAGEALLYDKMVIKYFNLQYSESHAENIFATSTDSPQAFLNSEVEPSKVKANLSYFVEYFSTRELMEDETYDEALGEHNLKNMTELSTIVFEKWKASNPKGYSKAYYEYIPPVDTNFREIIQNSQESWNDLPESHVESNFFLGMQKFNRIGSWVLLWNYARAKNMAILATLCEDHLANIVDNRTSRKASYDNYAEFNSVVSWHVLSPS